MSAFKSNSMKKLLKEPLVHFLLIGAGLFLFYSQVNDTKTSDRGLLSFESCPLVVRGMAVHEDG